MMSAEERTALRPPFSEDRRGFWFCGLFGRVFRFEQSTPERWDRDVARLRHKWGLAKVVGCLRLDTSALSPERLNVFLVAVGWRRDYDFTEAEGKSTEANKRFVKKLVEMSAEDLDEFIPQLEARYARLLKIRAELDESMRRSEQALKQVKELLARERGTATEKMRQRGVEIEYQDEMAAVEKVARGLKKAIIAVHAEVRPPGRTN